MAEGNDEEEEEGKLKTSLHLCTSGCWKKSRERVEVEPARYGLQHAMESKLAASSSFFTVISFRSPHGAHLGEV